MKVKHEIMIVDIFSVLYYTYKPATKKTQK